jgi:hypothetical protein
MLASGHAPDTWADMRGWGKGLLWFNGFNLGWYWPLLGPQMRAYVPGPLLREGSNEVVLMEFVRAPADASGEPLLLQCCRSPHCLLCQALCYVHVGHVVLPYGEFEACCFST